MADDVIVRLGAIDNGLSAVFEKAGQAVKDFGSAATKNLDKAAKSLMIAGAATTAMGIKSLKSFGQFEQSLNTAAVVAGGTSKDIQGLADVANKMGADLPLSAQDAADAMIEMARNGASLDDLKQQFPAIAKAATAAGSDLQQTAGVVQLAMNVWGKSLKSPAQAAEILVQTANLSNASVEEMRQAIADVGATSKIAGYDMQTTSTAIGLLTNAGLPAAQAAQDLNFALLRLIAPTKGVKSAMSELGISVRDQNGNMKPLPTILNDVAKATEGMGKAQRDAALKALFGTAGMKAMMPLLDAIKDKSGKASTSWEGFAKAIDKAAGSTARANKTLDEQASEMQKNVGAKIEQVGGNWESLRNKAMQASKGVTGAILDMMNRTLEWATESNDGIAQVIRGFVGLSPVIGPAVTALGAFITQSKTVISTISGFLSPVGLAIAALIAIGAAFYQAYSKSAALQQAVGKIGEAFQSVFGPIIQAAISAVQNFAVNFEDLGGQIAQVLGGIDWDGFASGCGQAVNSIVQALQQVIQFLVQVAQQFIESGAAANTWNFIVSVAQTISQALQQVVQFLIQVAQQFIASGAAANTWNFIASTIQTIWNTLTQLVSVIAQAVQGFIQAGLATQIWNGLVSIIQNVWTVLSQIGSVIGQVAQGFMQTGAASASWQAIVSIAQLVWQTLSQIFSILGNLLSSIGQILGATTTSVGGSTSIWQIMGQVIGTIVQTIMSIITIIAQVATVIITVVGGVVNTLLPIVTGLIQMIIAGWNSLVTFLQPVITAIQTLFQGLATFLGALWQGIIAVAQAIWGLFVALFTPIVAGIMTVWTPLEPFFSGIWGAIQSIFQTAIGIIQAIWTAGWNILSAVVSTVFNAISTIISTILNVIAGIIRAITAAIKGDWSGVWNAIKSIASTIWNGIKSLASTLFNGIKAVITAVWNAIKGVTSSIWNGIKGVISSVWNGIKGVITAGANAVKSIFTGAMNALKSVVSSVWGAIKGVFNAGVSFIKSVVHVDLGAAGRQIMDSFLNGLKSAWKAVQNFVGGIGNWIKQHKGPASYDKRLLIPAGQYIMNGLAKGLKTNFGVVQSQIGAVNDYFSNLSMVVPSVDSSQFTNNLNALNAQANATVSGAINQEISFKNKPAYVTLSLGGSDYQGFVDDISKQQDMSVALRKKRL